MKAPLLIAIAAALSAGAATAGSVVAPGATQSLSGSVLPLPGVTNAINGSSGLVPTSSGGTTIAQTVTLQTPPAATIEALRSAPGAVVGTDGGFTLNNVTINTASGPVQVSISVDADGNMTLGPVTEELPEVSTAPASNGSTLPVSPASSDPTVPRTTSIATPPGSFNLE